MKAIIIVDKIPKSCVKCIFADNNYLKCSVTKQQFYKNEYYENEQDCINGIMKDCPLTELNAFIRTIKKRMIKPMEEKEHKAVSEEQH